MPVPGRFSDEAEAQADARVGEVLNDKWTLERLLGAGGMGAVYAGRHRNGARAAVKVLHRYLSQHEEVRARFLREGYAANRVDRPGVVKVLDDDVVVGGKDDGTAYIVMELLEGQSLEARAETGWRVTERQFLAIADAVLDVLEAAHTNGVVHRDIKPDNLFIAKDDSGAERIKVLDFGLARLLEGRSMTTYGIAIGTPSYMSPEQAAGRNDEIDGRTDLFALAAAGFRLVTGRRLHEGSSPIDVMSKMATLPAPKIRSVLPQVSAAFARVIDRGLEFRREDRYENAAAMRSDVQNALAVLDLGAQPTAMLMVPSEKVTELSIRDFVEPSSQQLTMTDVPPPALVRQTIEPPVATSQRGTAPIKAVSLQVQPDTARGEPPTQASPVALAEPAPSVPSAPAFSVPSAALVSAVPPAPPPSSPSAPVPSAPEGPPDPPAPLPMPVHAEESLSGIPMQRVSLVPAVVIVGVLGLVMAVTYVGVFTRETPSPSVPAATLLHDAQVEVRDADVPASDAAPDAGTPVEASVVAALSKDAATPKPRTWPAHPATKPPASHSNTTKRPKH